MKKNVEKKQVNNAELEMKEKYEAMSNVLKILSEKLFALELEIIDGKKPIPNIQKDAFSEIVLIQKSIKKAGASLLVALDDVIPFYNFFEQFRREAEIKKSSRWATEEENLLYAYVTMMEGYRGRGNCYSDLENILLRTPRKISGIMQQFLRLEKERNASMKEIQEVQQQIAVSTVVEAEETKEISENAVESELESAEEEFIPVAEFLKQLPTDKRVGTATIVKSNEEESELEKKVDEFSTYLDSVETDSFEGLSSVLKKMFEGEKTKQELQALKVQHQNLLLEMRELKKSLDFIQERNDEKAVKLATISRYISPLKNVRSMDEIQLETLIDALAGIDKVLTYQPTKRQEVRIDRNRNVISVK